VGVWAPLRGQIRFDAATLDQWDLNARGKYIGYMPQNAELLPGTIAENIARFDPARADIAIVAAAQAAGVHELIQQLPRGYETIVDERGASLSNGQRQRIALARALYGSPFLVVLDEPNSNLDAEGEKALLGAILGVRERGGIVIVIAHRANVLAALDLILVMEGGAVKAFGPKASVLPRLQRPPKASPLKLVEGEAMP
jgi:ATP-binding cassette subfamily C protein